VAESVSLKELSARLKALEAVQAQLVALIVQAQWQPRYKLLDSRNRFVECLWCHGVLDAGTAREDVTRFLASGDTENLRPIGMTGLPNMGHHSACVFASTMRAVITAGGWQPMGK